MKTKMEKTQDVIEVLAPLGITILNSRISGDAITFQLKNGDDEEFVRQSALFQQNGSAFFFEYGFTIDLSDPFFYEGFDRVKNSFREVKEMLFLDSYDIKENMENCVDFRTGKRQVKRHRW